MVDAYVVIEITAAFAMLPSVFMFVSMARRRFCHTIDEKEDTESTGQDGVTVTELRSSKWRLRLAITYTCMQVGFLITMMSIAPMLAWVVGANGWREVSAILGSSTTWLAFTPLGTFLLLLGVFPNDDRAIRCALFLLSFCMVAAVAFTLAGSQTRYTSSRPTLAWQNGIICGIMAFSVLLLAPAWSNKIRLGRHRPGCLSELLFPPPFAVPDRLVRMWLVLRFAIFSVSFVYLIVPLLRAYANDFIDRWSQIDPSHAHFASELAIGISGVASGVIFTPKNRGLILRCLGRRSHPKMSDKLAARLSGFERFYEHDLGHVDSSAQQVV